MATAGVLILLYRQYFTDIFHGPRTSHKLFISQSLVLTLTVLVTTIDVQWERMGDVGSARYELALLLPCPTIRVLSYSN